MFSIVIYTHSDYFDILPIQLDYFDTIVPSTIPVYLLSNKQFPACKYKTILYEDLKPYASRLLTGIEQIPDEYIIITHENDVIIRFSPEFIEQIIQVMRDHDIDSVELKHDARGSGPLPINAETSMVKKTEYFYNVQPTVWKRDRLLQFLRAFPDKLYRTIEHDDTQKYMADNYKTYTLLCNNRIQSIWYELPVEYCYLHLTARLMLLPCTRMSGLHPEAQKEHDTIYLKYLHDSTRKIQSNLKGFDDSLVVNSIN